jgi:ABC-2 type transport system ATP-binding protein
MSRPLLEIKNIKKTYSRGADQIHALKGVSLTINEGEIFGLLGVNGAGKTTLSSIIATLHPATEGELIFDGKSVYENLLAYRYQLGFCPQHPNLQEMITLEDNLLFAGRLYGMDDDTIKKRISLLSAQLGLTPYLKKTADVLSGGYKQRFMIARSLIHEPKLVLLDEPTVGLDPHIRRQLWTIIKDLKKNGITVILTTHYLDEAEQLSDRVCILDGGKIKLIDTPDKLITDFKEKNLEDVFIKLMDENIQS